MSTDRLSVSTFLELETVGSTQDEARRLLNESVGAHANIWVRTRAQTAGRGRQGRSWLATDGALLLSVGFRLAGQGLRKQLVSLWAGEALYRSLTELGGRCDAVFLKWPNDLVMPLPSSGSLPAPEAGFAKIGGILAEGFGADTLVVGWGVNLGSSPRDSKLVARSLEEAGVFKRAPTAAAFATVLRRVFLSSLAEWEAGGLSAEEALIQRLIQGPMKPLWGRHGVLTWGQAGQALTLASNGALRVRLENGSTLDVSAGEFHFGA